MRRWWLMPTVCGVVLALLPARVLAGWALLSDQNSYVTAGIPEEAFGRLGEFAKQGSKLCAITFAPNGGWAILLDKNGYFTRNIPDEAFEMLGKFAKQGSELKAISFTPTGGWAILFDKNGYFTRNIPDAAFTKLGELAKKGAALKAITFTPGNGWAILYDKNGYATHNIPADAHEQLGKLAKRGALRSLTFTSDGSTIRLSQNDAPTRAKVLERMAFHKVPGMSVAIIQNGKVVVERGYGEVKAGGGQPVTAKTRFQAASISKPVTALGALVLAKQGKSTGR